MTSRFARWPLLVAAALVIGLACQPDAYPTRLFLDDFETLCDGVPCGWEQTAGESGRARWVETIHPGEHALELTDDVVVRRTGIVPAERPMVTTTLDVRVAATCDTGSTLELSLVVADATGATRDETLPLSFFSGESDWTNLSPAIVFEMPLTDPVVRAVVLRKSGAGRCRIGELAIDDGTIDSASCG
ncbi:MAG: hypothetical protein AB8I08_02775 [Sandaracinaceae bacterium]